MKNHLLVTTSIQDTWLKEKNISRLFLTKACNLFSAKSDLENLNYYNLEYHWNDRVKLINDHDYLKNFYEIVLGILGNQLNTIHNENHDINYWRIIIGPWLIHYISIIYDRWEMLRLAFSNDKNFLYVDLDQNEIIPKDFNHFIDIMQTDEWNHQIYQRILKNVYNSKINVIEKIKIKTPVYKSHSDYSISLNFKIISIVDNFLKLFNNSNKFFFYESYFSFFRLFRLNFSLLQIPRFYSNEFLFSPEVYLDKDLRQIEIKYESENMFENFFLKNLLKDIPVNYLEGYSQIKEYIEKLKFKPKVIITANAYWNNDIFKFWLSKKKDISKIVISCHGGSLPPLFDTFNHEEDISDFYTYWFKSKKFNRVHLPPNKVHVKKKTKAIYCSYLGFESPRYSYRISAGPITESVLKVFNQSINFYDSLNSNIQKKFKIRPYSNMGWETSLRYKDVLGEEKLDLNSKYYEFLFNSKWIICSYCQTTFSEAMYTGIPTTLLYIPSLNETIEEAQELIKILKKAKIIFTDSNKAAKHINKYWSNPNEWWESKEVMNAKKLFYKMAYNNKKNWNVDWANFLKSLL